MKERERMCTVCVCPNYKVNCVTTVLNIVTENWTLTVFNILKMVDIGDVLNAKKQQRVEEIRTV